jgi:proteic killer suppression protein
VAGRSWGVRYGPSATPNQAAGGPVWLRERSRRLDTPTQRAAWRNLAMLDAAEILADLRVPPGNRLEKLSGDRGGHYSIRINRQWRICFRWSDSGPEDIEIVDYH